MIVLIESLKKKSDGTNRNFHIKTLLRSIINSLRRYLVTSLYDANRSFAPHTQ